MVTSQKRASQGRRIKSLLLLACLGSFWCGSAKAFTLPCQEYSAAFRSSSRNEQATSIRRNALMTATIQDVSNADKLSAIANTVRKAEVVFPFAERIVAPEPPSWLQKEIADFLLSLSEDELMRAEAQGVVATLTQQGQDCQGHSFHGRIPAALQDVLHGLAAIRRTLPGPFDLALASEAENVVKSSMPATGKFQGVGKLSRNKAQQILSLGIGMQEYLHTDTISRVVDVGSGLGHLTSHLHQQLAVPAVGLEISQSRVNTAAALASARNLHDVDFETADVADVGKLESKLRRGDAVVGLHACGSLGDVLVEAACRAGSREAAERGVSVALVCCCLHKLRGGGGEGAAGELRREREALSERGRLAGLTLPLDGLKKAGMATDSRRSLAGREARFQLRMLLHERGIFDEVATLTSRHRIRPRAIAKGLDFAAEEVLGAMGQPPPLQSELETVRKRSASDSGGFGQLRRLSLLASIVGDVVELAVVLDRAVRLEEAGMTVRVVQLFPHDISPRNLAIFASPARD